MCVNIRSWNDATVLQFSGLKYCMTFHRPKKEQGFVYSQEDYEWVLSLHTRKSMESVKEEEICLRIAFTFSNLFA
ncbi:uncharacterized protein LOC120536865 isoform X3 [Polypterus senegalus]|uniref:uncharacterized protein LOC120536865 isoform X3 n=1 Tax=Polypterus senegalus TaxID=55291 RepID=UPI00196605BE|nr:uncharacterized protein LOC120536865 isoform X3 [Polypterus senegalus]